MNGLVLKVGAFSTMKKVWSCLGFGICVSVTGCPLSSSSETNLDPLATGSIEQRRIEADNEYGRELAEVELRYGSCIEQLKTQPTCTLPGTVDASARLTTSVHLADESFRDHICNALQPFRGFITADSHPYFFYGAQKNAGAGIPGQGGVDYVWDLSHLQAAAFAYQGKSVAGLAGVDAGVYAGFGFGTNKSSVIDAWSGVFISGSASAGLPFHLAQAGGSMFVSEDRTIYGGAVAGSIGLGLEVKFPVTVGLSKANWAGWDEETEALAQGRLFQFLDVGYTIETAVDGEGLPRKYIQFNSPRDMALGLMAKIGPGAILPAVPTLIGTQILKRGDLIIEYLCPDVPDAGWAEVQGNTCSMVGARGASCTDAGGGGGNDAGARTSNDANTSSGNDAGITIGNDAGNHVYSDAGAHPGTDAGTRAGTDAGDAGDHAAFCKSCLGALSAAHPGCKFYYPSLAGWGLCMECPDGTVPYRFIDVPGGGTAFTPPGHEGGQCPGCSPL
jgi:hypothetical protein